MTTFKVEPVPGCEDEIVEEFSRLSLPCANGFASMLDILEENDPSLNDRCGQLADQFELYAVPLPDCPRRVLILSIDQKASGFPRWIHGTLPVSEKACERGSRIAIRQFGLVDPTWEKRQ
ncbi:hypothetical protein [Roseibium sp.]|uniref:hypothetical protein n=1 Tax=Roseibium sp. TaxID=1936156 RepID=UPI0032675E83